VLFNKNIFTNHIALLAFKKIKVPLLKSEGDIYNKSVMDRIQGYVKWVPNTRDFLGGAVRWIIKINWQQHTCKYWSSKINICFHRFFTTRWRFESLLVLGAAGFFSFFLNSFVKSFPELVSVILIVVLFLGVWSCEGCWWATVGFWCWICWLACDIYTGGLGCCIVCWVFCEWICWETT